MLDTKRRNRGRVAASWFAIACVLSGCEADDDIGDDGGVDASTTSADDDEPGDEEVSQGDESSGMRPSDSSEPPPPAGPPDPEESIVEFRIRLGTGPSSWNVEQELVTVYVGQVLRIYNDDGIGHTLHASGAPVDHGEWIEPGAFMDHTVVAPYDPGEGPPRPTTTTAKRAFGCGPCHETSSRSAARRYLPLDHLHKGIHDDVTSAHHLDKVSVTGRYHDDPAVERLWRCRHARWRGE